MHAPWHGDAFQLWNGNWNICSVYADVANLVENVWIFNFNKHKLTGILVSVSALGISGWFCWTIHYRASDQSTEESSPGFAAVSNSPALSGGTDASGVPNLRDRRSFNPGPYNPDEESFDTYLYGIYNIRPYDTNV